MSNPFHVDTPQYAAWERVRTLRISPDTGDANLQELIEEIIAATEEMIEKEVIASANEAALEAVTARIAEAQDLAESISGKVNRLVDLLDKRIEIAS